MYEHPTKFPNDMLHKQHKGYRRRRNHKKKCKVPFTYVLRNFTGQFAVKPNKSEFHGTALGQDGPIMLSRFLTLLMHEPIEKVDKL